MTNPLKSDRFLIQFKDWILLAVALLGLLGYIGKAYQMESRVQINEKIIAKCEPKIEEHEIKIALVYQKLDQIIEQLKDLRKGQIRIGND